MLQDVKSFFFSIFPFKAAAQVFFCFSNWPTQVKNLKTPDAQRMFKMECTTVGCGSKTNLWFEVLTGQCWGKYTSDV